VSGASSDIPCAHGCPPAAGRLRTVPEDFRVDEVLGFEPDGSGAHALLTVSKREANTGWVAAQLARHAGVHVRDVGFSGHKDRHAVTQQAYSVPLPADVDAATCLAWRGEGYTVVGATRHGRKLRPGSHRANRFELRIREVQGQQPGIESRLRSIAETGVPNYFGPQRFGRGGANLQRAREWAASGQAARDRVQRGFALSAARSHLFNAVLAARVRRGDWNQLLPGEAVMLDGRRSFFHAPVIDAMLEQRARDFDVHPSGPLPGRGEVPATDIALAVETSALAPESSLLEWLDREGVTHERRGLRLPVRDISWSFEDDGNSLMLRFVLPRGAFATAVLHELLTDAWDVGEGGED
jgi:tRNA pseudouridine13 synthase